jgi:glycosyltransferase involved in cell wall biosynthesis
MNSSPQASIVIPVYNGEKYLRVCIESAINQTMTDIEILIGNDHSKDSSTDIIREFTDKRIRKFYRQKNVGQVSNTNFLVQEAKGHIIQFLCQDDVLEKNCLEEETKVFVDNPQIGMSFCKTIRIDEHDNRLGECQLGDLPGTIGKNLACQLFFYYGCIPGNLSTVCVRRSIFQEIGLFDESYGVAADFEMWVRICRQYQLGVVHKRLIRLRSHVDQLSRATSSGVEFIRINRKIRARLLTSFVPELRGNARRYELARQNVLDVHYSLKCLRSLRFHDFRCVVQIIGPMPYILGLLLWFLTLNNRLYRPKAKFNLL